MPGTTRKRNDFINFIIDSNADGKLTNEFLEIRTPENLYDFFQKKGYNDIPYNDCKDILMAARRMRNRHIPAKGKDISTTCVGRQQDY
jgi:hypothetical protein